MKNTMLPLCLLLALFACKKSDFVTQTKYNETPDELAQMEEYLNLPYKFVSYQQVLPNFLSIMGMEVKPPNSAKATLGRVLFYDKNLSVDHTVSCASCHKQALAFADDAAVSTGVYGLKGTRNAMALANTASFSAHYNMATGPNPRLLWDQRAANVPEQSILAFINNHEMGMTLPGVVDRIKEQPYYPALWKQVYGDFKVDQQQVLECLQEFVGAIAAPNTPFDHILEQVNGNINAMAAGSVVLQIYLGDTTISTGNMTSDLSRGRDIFTTNCTKCHSVIRPVQEVFEACNGLDLVYADQGKGSLTGNPSDNGVFKAPSLRNIALTAPYMHDGRFKTLEEVVDFYSDGVKMHPNLHPLMLHAGSPNLHLTPEGKSDLLVFLNSLTDNQVLLDERFSDPFKR